MKPQEWRIDVDAPRERVYAALEDLLFGRGEQLPGVRNVRAVSPEEAAWTVDTPAGTMAVRLRVSERHPPERLAAEGRGDKLSLAVRAHLTELDTSRTRCHLALDMKLPFFLDKLARGIVAREHERIGRELARLLSRRAATGG